MRSLVQLQKNAQLRAPAAQRKARVVKLPQFSKGHRLRSCGNLARNSGSNRAEAAQALQALQQQQRLPPSVRSTNPTQPNPHQTLQRPNLSLQLPALPSPNLSLHQPLRRTPLRKLPQHLEPQQLPLHHQFQTGSHQPSLSQPGPQEARRPGLTQQSGQRA